MWSQWTEQAKKGFSEFAEKTGEAFEKTGDALSKAASNPHSRQTPKKPDPNLPRNLESLPAEEVGLNTSGSASASGSPTNSNTTNTPTNTPRNSNSSNSSKSKSPQDIRARATAVLAGVQAREESVAKAATPKLPLKSPVFSNLQNNFKTGWHSVVENAKKGVQTAQDLVEKEQQRLELLMLQRDAPKYFARDLNLSLDVPALKDAEVVYVTDRIISMSHPALPSSTDPNSITGERKLAAVCHLLEKRHGTGNVMIWNLSEVTNYHQQAAQVLERVGPILAFSFPGSPAPPLGLWLQLLLSLEKWLQASPQNVAVVHCLTGKGRTSTVLAAFLCWMAEAGFAKTKMMDALQYIAQCKKMPIEELTIPSQRRYAQYFTNMLEGVRPSQPPILLKRIIMSEAPHFALGPPLKNKTGDGKESKASQETKKDGTAGTEDEHENKARMGCAPYLQVFQAGQLLHTVAATLHFQQQPEALPFCQVADGSIAFHVDQIIQGDVLIRCRHLAHSTKQKISMFRAAFHTGYVPPNVLRFTKQQLDGACHDPRFPDDFFVDLILESCSAEQTSHFYAQQEAEQKEKEKAEAEADGKVVKDAVVSASTYDSMLHRDSRFWDVISQHLNDQEGDENNEEDQDTAKSRMGKTVGKRRVFTSNASKSSKGGDASTEDSSSAKKPKAEESLQTFSIGGELDFLPEPEKKSNTPTSRPSRQTKSPKKDSLMEALMGALGDDHGITDTEEIVFEDTPAPAPAPAVAQPSPTIVALPPAPAPATTEEKADAKDTAEAASSETNTESSVAEAKTPPPPERQETTENTESAKEMEQLLDTGDSDDVDVDALLGDDDDEDFNLDDYNDDEEDAELEDLENFLSQTK